MNHTLNDHPPTPTTDSRDDAPIAQSLSHHFPKIEGHFTTFAFHDEERIVVCGGCGGCGSKGVESGVACRGGIRGSGWILGSEFLGDHARGVAGGGDDLATGDLGAGWGSGADGDMGMGQWLVGGGLSCDHGGTWAASGIDAIGTPHRVGLVDVGWVGWTNIVAVGNRHSEQFRRYRE